MRRAVLLLTLLTVVPVHGSSLKMWERGELVENPRWYSQNQRFCVVLRRYDRLGDFDAKPAEVVFRWDEPRPDNEEPRERPESVDAALYDGNHLLAVFPVPSAYGRHVFVTDSGEYVIAQSWWPDDQIAAIYSDDGTLVRELKTDEVFTPNDRGNPLRDRDPVLSVRDHSLVLPAGKSEILIDLATGKLLHPKRDIYPTWRAWTSGDFAATAVHRVVPHYPEVAMKARISGVVIVDVYVDESGRVIDTVVVKPLPFGLDTAAATSAKQWLFLPGRPTRGLIEFHFRPLNDDEWREIVLQSAE